MSQPLDEPGLYETLVTRHLEDALQRSELERVLDVVDDADVPDVLARHLATVLRQRLPRGDAERASMVRQLLAVLSAPQEEPAEPLQHLLRLSPAAGPGVRSVTDLRPSTPLTDVALLTNAPGEPGLGHELRAEIASADRVYLLCAFVQWHGLRYLEDSLADARARGVPIRVVTTTYIGGTERKALDRLINDYGAQIQVQYDARSTRLHAKAWLFERNTGFHTAYVGSSNLSRAALVDGAEWNVRLSSHTTGHLLDKFVATFDAYWNSDEFQPYRGEVDAERLDLALAQAKGYRDGTRDSLVSGLEVRPYTYQQAILEALAAERGIHDRHRNLVVAATGTGKTVIAALDYRSMCRDGRRPRLLFVAHRREILMQSLRTYREVLNDGSFGELYVDGQQPQRWDHVFASIQSLTSYGVQKIPVDAFDVVVIDEFHHAQATTYRKLLAQLQPLELLGLTATPERGDGLDVRSLFDGRIAAELRIWDAVQQGLLCPFHYFGVSDGVDLRAVAWRQGRYDTAELDAIYSGSDARARMVLKQVSDKVLDPRTMRALGFCVSVRHAEFMAATFNRAGIPSVALSAASGAQTRDREIARLKRGEVAAIFSVDIFNEGVDIPEVDTVLLLRPTESPTIFLQQLGRGLRLSPGKDVLTVLDFVGQHRKEYRLDARFTALTGHRGEALEKQVSDDFPLLPSGCQIVLDRLAQRQVLENLRDNLQVRWPQLVNELRDHPTTDLREFLTASNLDLSQVVRRAKGRSWTELCAAAGLTSEPSAGEAALLRRVRAFAHVDDPVRATGYGRLLADPSRLGPTLPERRLADMLVYSLWPTGIASTAGALAELQDMPLLRRELEQVIELSLDGAARLTASLPGPLSSVPLQVHATYTREEVLAALGHARPGRPPSQFREGVLFTTVDDEPVDAFFITLKKSEAAYSPSTMYRDYPLSRTLFHWETQSTTSLASPTGRRYVEGGSTPLLFVREQRDGEFGRSPYVFLGDATHVDHSGDRPIAITWRLRTPMPADFFTATSIAV